MNKTQELHELGQSLWLDNITRDILNDGTLKKYVDAFDITGLTSNPSIFDKAISGSKAYDEAIADKAKTIKSPEALFVELALEDYTRRLQATSRQLLEVQENERRLLARDLHDQLGQSSAIRQRSQK